MGQKERHHYVPRVYLKQFTTQSEQIYAYDLRQRRSFGPTSLDNVAQVKGFHELPLGQIDADESPSEIPNDPNFVEKHFAQNIEPRFGDCIEEILRRVARARKSQAFRRVIPTDLKHLLGHMVYLQLSRTRETRRQHRDAMESGATALIRKIAKMENLYDETDVDPEKLTVELDEEAAKASHIDLLFDQETAEEVVNSWLEQHVFVIGTTTPDNPFITSDHPVVMYNHLDGPLALLVPGMEFALPLSPLTILLVMDSDLLPPRELSTELTDCELTHVQPESVTFYNSQQVFQCHSQVYSRDDDFSLVEEILEQHPEIGTEEWDKKRGIVVDDGQPSNEMR